MKRKFFQLQKDAGGSMWIKAVARITPVLKHFNAMK
jgi:hypothetical protein